MRYYANAQVLQPLYMRQFVCTGTECKDNCCHDRVDIDRDTYYAFKAREKDPLRQLFFDSVVVNGGSNPYMYASIQADAGQPCPFLNESDLCSIHAKLGEEYLSCVCYTVPRRVNRIGGSFEISMRLICPEACRVALLNEPIMEFESFISDVSMKTHIITEMTEERALGVQPAWFDIRSAFIDILQDRRFDLGHRLFLAALTAEKLDNINRRSDPSHEILAYLDDATSAYTSDDFATELRQAQCKDDTLFARLLDIGRFLANNINTKDVAFRVYINRFLECLNGSSVVENALQYISAEANAGSYLSGKEHVFENWIVNEVFSRCFPLRNQGRILEELTKLTLYYFLMRIILVANISVCGVIDDEVLVDFIHRYNKPLDLNKQFDTAMEDFISRERLADVKTVMAMTIYHP